MNKEMLNKVEEKMSHMMNIDGIFYRLFVYNMHGVPYADFMSVFASLEVVNSAYNEELDELTVICRI